MRDTVLVPPMRSVTIVFDAYNPEQWASHCHNLSHQKAGMMTMVTLTRASDRGSRSGSRLVLMVGSVAGIVFVLAMLHRVLVVDPGQPGGERAEG